MHKISARLEALLFSSPEPVKLEQLANVTELPAEVVKKHLAELKSDLAGSGLRLIEHRNSFQLAAAGQFALDIKTLRKEKPPVLSPAALEVLAIIAYHQPVAKNRIEEIRGVSSDQSIKNLLTRGLIEELQNKAKTQTSYQTTAKFLSQVGLEHIDKLPKLDVRK